MRLFRSEKAVEEILTSLLFLAFSKVDYVAENEPQNLFQNARI
jgi:hypothetical protein